MLTQGALMRGVLTAWSWLVPTSVRAYAPDAVRDAIAWIAEGNHVDVDRVARAIAACEALLEGALNKRRAG